MILVRNLLYGVLFLNFTFGLDNNAYASSFFESCQKIIPNLNKVKIKKTSLIDKVAQTQIQEVYRNSKIQLLKALGEVRAANSFELIDQKKTYMITSLLNFIDVYSKVIDSPSLADSQDLTKVVYII